VTALLSLVEKHTGVPVSVVGVGPERDDVVVRGRPR
jgi:adenylosuccinate synthase